MFFEILLVSEQSVRLGLAFLTARFGVLKRTPSATTIQ